MQTAHTLTRDLRALGLGSGDVVMVHSSLSALGFVLGGPQTVLRALLATLGETGTLVMPAFSPEVSDPGGWTDPRIPPDRLEEARGATPSFDPKVTPTSMGVIPEAFRTWPGVLRSAHPQVSVTAHGPEAAAIVARHGLDWGQGPRSPFEALYDRNARLLLMGVGFNRATLLHFAEATIPNGRRKTRIMPLDGHQGRQWVSAPDSGDDLGVHFPALGEAFLATGACKTGMVGEAASILAPARDLVGFARTYLSQALPG
jgi:aminoglycoside 3-N-acetyltransferase